MKSRELFIGTADGTPDEHFGDMNGDGDKMALIRDLGGVLGIPTVESYIISENNPLIIDQFSVCQPEPDWQAVLCAADDIGQVCVLVFSTDLSIYRTIEELCLRTNSLTLS